MVVSRQAAEAAGIDRAQTLHEARVKGRVGKVEFLALEAVPGAAARARPIWHVPGRVHTRTEQIDGTCIRHRAGGAISPLTLLYP